MAGNNGTKENSFGIKKVITYQNFITVKNRTFQERLSEYNQERKFKEQQE